VRPSLIGSILFHVVVIGLLFWNFSGSRKSAPVTQPVAVEVITPSEFSQRQSGKQDAKPEQPVTPAEVKAPEAPKAAPKEAEAKPVVKAALTEAAPPPKHAEAEQPAKPVETPAKAEDRKEAKAESKKPEAKAEAKEPKKAEAKAQPKSAPKPEARKPEVKSAAAKPRKPHEAEHAERSFDADRIAALLRKNDAESEERENHAPASDLRTAPSRNYSERMAALINRDPNAGQLSAAEQRAPWRPSSSLQEQAAGLDQGNAPRNAASCGDVVRSRIEHNWDLPFGRLSADATIVRLRIELSPDGSLSRQPYVLDGSTSPGFQAVADAAIRAAIRGQPYPIPPDQFDRCRIMNLTFDPRDMYGG
jgi:colicin import membrane protein